MHYFLLIAVTLAFSKITVSAELLVDKASCSDENVYCDIQTAVDAASEGDTVKLTRGRYELWQESITIDKSITLAGESPENTLLLGEGNAPAALVSVTSDAGVVELKNLTIADRVVSGSSAMGPGGLDYRGGDLTIDSVFFKNNRGGWGGAVRIDLLFGTVHIKNSRFIENTGFAGGGIAVYNGSALELFIEHTRFSGNNAIFSGGALLMRDVSEAQIVDSDISNNTAGNTGGGIHIFTETGSIDLTVKESTIVGNEAANVGGLSTLGDDIMVTITDSRIQGNKSRNGLSTPDCAGQTIEVLGNSSIDQQNNCMN